MVALKPIFPGKDNSDLLYLIMKARGTTPSVEDFEHLNPELCGNEALLCGVKLERAPRRALWWASQMTGLLAKQSNFPATRRAVGSIFPAT
jgi:hypothetical protein